ncbi:hypothetical protein BX600DRAFT_523543 [Xylariales sp. PMI_506]|nr:hypothetical protein BX600DRAFT_523543 [Xylariales sp. PMI_506]
MQFSRLTLGLALTFAGVVLGDLHASCTCHNGDSYNWRITTAACTVYNDAGYQWGGAEYDTPSGRCTADSDASIAGDQWEAACKSVATTGFQCSSGEGTCFAEPDDVRGWC